MSKFVFTKTTLSDKLNIAIMSSMNANRIWPKVNQRKLAEDSAYQAEVENDYDRLLCDAINYAVFLYFKSQPSQLDNFGNVQTSVERLFKIGDKWADELESVVYYIIEPIVFAIRRLLSDAAINPYSLVFTSFVNNTVLIHIGEDIRIKAYEKKHGANKRWQADDENDNYDVYMELTEGMR